jgi:hypothetical protein
MQPMIVPRICKTKCCTATTPTRHLHLRALPLLLRWQSILCSAAPENLLHPLPCLTQLMACLHMLHMLHMPHPLDFTHIQSRVREMMQFESHPNNLFNKHAQLSSNQLEMLRNTAHIKLLHWNSTLEADVCQ